MNGNGRIWKILQVSIGIAVLLNGSLTTHLATTRFGHRDGVELREHLEERLKAYPPVFLTTQVEALHLSVSGLQRAVGRVEGKLDAMLMQKAAGD